MSTFDPEQFLDSTINEANATKRDPCPIGEHPGTIQDVAIKGGEGKDGRPWLRLDVKVRLESDAIKQEMGLPFHTTTWGIMLDLTEAGAIDTGRNRNTKLGQLREATGLNGAGFTPRALIGHSAMFNVTHRPYQGEIYDDIKGVRALAG